MRTRPLYDDAPWNGTSPLARYKPRPLNGGMARPARVCIAQVSIGHNAPVRTAYIQLPAAFRDEENKLKPLPSRVAFAAGLRRRLEKMMSP
jgi:hypothetical protein